MGDSGGGLTIEGLCVHYGGSVALNGINLNVRPGEVAAVLGSNGAGKSTLGRACAGLVRSDRGSITFCGEDITTWPPHKVRRAGMVYLPEGRGIFPALTVRENLQMAVRLIQPKRAMESAVAEAIELFPVLGDRARQRAGTLSGGEQQMLSLVRALVAKPRLVIADELSMGLAPQVVDAIFDGLEKATAAGITVILIEQFVDRALTLADYCVILRRGEVTWQGDAKEARESALHHYMGLDPEEG
jgi:branched-chain amino acid transport system ATP-binding protein